MKYIFKNTDYKLIKKVLIANQGEIAVRIIRSCQEMNIETVAVYSSVDKEALHVQLADESVCIGPGPLLKSYMHVPSIIQAAISTGAQAIHPGYGMLSEDHEFAKLVEDSGFIWIGPKAKTIKALGNKINARAKASKAKVPVIEGSPKLKNAKEAAKWALNIGYPVIVKAANSGGGRGITIAKNEKEIKTVFKDVLSISKTLFKDDSVYLEKYIKNSRHIEVQILGDMFGNIRHLYDRDCSLQRNKQKLIEEAPSTFINDKTRVALTQAAVKLGKMCNYISAGTAEFLVDNKQNFYFMEMNTRIQVEHPITEEITGFDIIKEQLKIAGGKKLTWEQDDISIHGHSIEIRINAEKPLQNFQPGGGTIEFLHIPGGRDIRFDSAIYNGWALSTFVDSNIAKLIVKGKTRKSAIIKARRALEELVIGGVKTNIHFQHNLLLSDEFINDTHSTTFVEQKFLPKYLKKYKK